jgi:hypothetical protein
MPFWAQSYNSIDELVDWEKKIIPIIDLKFLDSFVIKWSNLAYGSYQLHQPIVLLGMTVHM